MDYVEALQESLGKKAKIKMMPLQPEMYQIPLLMFQNYKMILITQKHR